MLLFQVKQKTAPSTASGQPKGKEDYFMKEEGRFTGLRLIEIEGTARGLDRKK